MDTPQYTSFLDRLQYFINEEGLSLNKFGEMTGFANGGINRVLKERTNFGVDKLLTIMEQFPKLNPAWLLRGVGTMLLDQKHESENTADGPDIYTLLGDGYGMPKEDLIQILRHTARQRDDLAIQVIALSNKVNLLTEKQQAITDILMESHLRGKK